MICSFGIRWVFCSSNPHAYQIQAELEKFPCVVDWCFEFSCPMLQMMGNLLGKISFSVAVADARRHRESDQNVFSEIGFWIFYHSFLKLRVQQIPHPSFFHIHPSNIILCSPRHIHFPIFNFEVNFSIYLGKYFSNFHSSLFNRYASTSSSSSELNRKLWKLLYSYSRWRPRPFMLPERWTMEYFA